MKAAIKGLNNIRTLNAFFTFLFLVINTCFTIRFESNDDAVMLLILASLLKNYKTEVSPKLIFMESDLAIIEFPIKSN